MQNMMKMKKLSLLLLALGSCSGTWAADDPVIQQLVEQAQYWQKKNRADLAADVWRKLLRANPRHPQALVQLGLIEAQAGHGKEAQDLYARANALATPPSGLGDLSSKLKLESAPPAVLSSARKNAQSGQPEEAIKKYRGILGTTKPAGQIGLEYYQTLAATKEGWGEARQGLEELTRSNPGDPRYLLALARHLTYREGTRREGIRQLAGLVQRQEGGQEASKSWRQALVWLNAQASDRGLFTAYLSRFPQDLAVSERLRSLVKPMASYRPNLQSREKNLQAMERQAGFRMLSQGQIDQAEDRFRAVLQNNPRDVSALGGLGIIRLRQEAFGEALQLLDQAIALDKRGAKRWQQARNSAQYWLLIQEVLAAKQAGQVELAQDKLAQALEVDDREPAGQVIYAELLVQKKNYVRAESIYRRLLKAAPLNQGAFTGLVGLLNETGRSDEAMRMVASLDSDSVQKMGGLQQVKAGALLKLAEADEQAGAYQSAAEKLEDAMLLDPLNPWIRLGLARQYQRMNDAAGASALLDNLLEGNPNLPEALYARALLYGAQQREWEGLQAMEQIPVKARTPDMVREQRRLWIAVQVQRARQFAEQGNMQQANSLMAQAESVAGQHPSQLAQVAAGWSELGQSGKAVRMLREMISRSPVQDVGIRVQYAGALLGMRQDAELTAVLGDLSVRQLSVEQQKDVNNIIAAYTLQQTDALREAGRLAEAYDTINPALEQSDDPRLFMALARIYNSAGEPAQALQLAESVIAREPDELDHRLFAAGVAIGAKSMDKAAGHAEAALELSPDHPRALATAGRVEKARGNLSKAMEYFQAAQALEGDRAAFAGAPGNLALRLVDEVPVTAAGQTVPGNRVERSGLLPIPGVRRQRDQPAAMPYQQPATLRQSPARMSPLAPDYAVDQRSGYLPQTVLPLPGANSRLADAGLTDRPLSRQAPDRYAGTARYEAPVAPLPAVSTYASAGYARQNTMPPPATLTSNSMLLPTSVARQPATASMNRERTASEEIRVLESKYTATIDVGASLRNRSGDAGTSRLSEVETPIEAKIPLDYSGAGITLRASPVLLRAGDINLADPGIASRFGSAALAPSASLRLTDQTARGMAFSAGYNDEHIAADIGVTPAGFKVVNAVGGLSLTGQIDELALKAALSRRAVTDSMLSYAGARDPLSGQIWGGVVKSAGRLSAGYESGNFGLYAGAGLAVLTGQNVKSNSQIEGGIGAYFRAYQSIDTRVTLGLNLTAFGYRDNLGYYTLGHGGYFSPQQYVSLGLPFDVAGRQGKLSYQIGGDVGVRHFRQDRAAYFPGNAGLQAAWEERVAADPQSGAYAAYYKGESVTGAGYNFYGSFEYLMAPKLALGGRMKFDNSRNFAQQSGLLFLRYAFDALPQSPAFPPRTLKPLYLGESL